MPPTSRRPTTARRPARPHRTLAGLPRPGARRSSIVDQLTKAWLVANLVARRVDAVVGDCVRLVFSQNTGALFGLFRDNAALFGARLARRHRPDRRLPRPAGRSLYLSVALGLLLGGALGNLIDRLRAGYVVDFVDIGIGDVRWYTFNVADAAISTAIVLLIGCLRRLRGRDWRRAPDVEPTVGLVDGRSTLPAPGPGPAGPRRRRTGSGSTATSPTSPACRGATSRS